MPLDFVNPRETESLNELNNLFVQTFTFRFGVGISPHLLENLLVLDNLIQPLDNFP